MSKFTDAIERELEGLVRCNPGPASCCPECVDQFGFCCAASMREAEEDSRVVDEGGFSSSSCDSCGSSLGGDRYVAHAFEDDGDGNPVTDSVVHLSICTDCLLFHANGDEPESWEG